MWGHFTFWMSDITVLKYLLQPLHLLWYLSSVKWVSILSAEQAGFGQYWVTELGVRAPSSASADRGKTERPTLKADRSQSPQKKQTSIMFYLALS